MLFGDVLVKLQSGDMKRRPGNGIEGVRSGAQLRLGNSGNSVGQHSN